MSRNKIHIEIKLNFYNEYFTGGGKGTSAIDCYTLKNIDGMPYIPASALKGKLRYIATEIYDSLFKKECKKFKQHSKIKNARPRHNLTLGVRLFLGLTLAKLKSK